MRYVRVDTDVPYVICAWRASWAIVRVLVVPKNEDHDFDIWHSSSYFAWAVTYLVWYIQSQQYCIVYGVDRNSQVKRNGYERNAEGGERNAHPTKWSWAKRTWAKCSRWAKCWSNMLMVSKILKQNAQCERNAHAQSSSQALPQKIYLAGELVIV